MYSYFWLFILVFFLLLCFLIEVFDVVVVVAFVFQKGDLTFHVLRAHVATLDQNELLRLNKTCNACSTLIELL